MNTLETKLATLGYTLPEPSAPVANYVPYVIVGSLIFVAGQIPTAQGQMRYTGPVSSDNLEAGQEAAKLCALNILAQVKAAAGDLSRIRRCVRLCGYIQSHADFSQQSVIMDTASNLMVDLFGEAGRHARTSISCIALPRNAMVEIDAIFEMQ